MGADETKKIKIGSARPFSVTPVKRYLPPSDLARGFQYVSINDDSDCGTCLTEVVDASDPRPTWPEMTEAKREEVTDLFKRGTLKVILQEKVPPNAKILPGRFVLANKSTEDGKVKFKARYVISGHRDRMKDTMVHDAATLLPQSIRLLLALPGMHDFDI